VISLLSLLLEEREYPLTGPKLVRAGRSGHKFVEYYFHTDKGTKYRVSIWPKQEGTWNVSFGSMQNDFKLTGEKDAYRVMSTVEAAVKKEIERVGMPKKIEIDPYQEYTGDDRRKRIFANYFLRSMPGSTASEEGDTVVLRFPDSK